MKVLTFSRAFPKRHPKAGQPTWFVEKTWNSFNVTVRDTEFYHLGEDHVTENNKHLPYGIVETFLSSLSPRNGMTPKSHTIRAGSRFKPGDMASLRVWSGKPYRSKQIEFAQVEVKKVWSIENVISHTWWTFRVDDKFYCGKVDVIANNDGLELQDFIDWFTIHPKSIDREFKGQIICWDESINY